MLAGVQMNLANSLITTSNICGLRNGLTLTPSEVISLFLLLVKKTLSKVVSTVRQLVDVRHIIFIINIKQILQIIQKWT